jgi:ribonucleotide monophosphatase NagD (HAD superfamily)
MLGKPGAAMFHAALEALGGPAPGRTLMIGDSPEHDIAGAAALGIRTLLVTSGPQSGTEGAAPPDYATDRLAW